MLPGPCVAMCLLYPSDTISGVRRGELREHKKDVEGKTAQRQFLTESNH